MTNNTLAATDGTTWTALKDRYRAAWDLEDDVEAERILQEVDVALGDRTETDSFMLTCWDNPPVIELVDEQGRHLGWENVSTRGDLVPRE